MSQAMKTFQMSRAVLIQAHEMYSDNIAVAEAEGDAERVEFYKEMTKDLVISIRALEMLSERVEAVDLEDFELAPVSELSE